MTDPDNTVTTAVEKARELRRVAGWPEGDTVPNLQDIIRFEDEGSVQGIADLVARHAGKADLVSPFEALRALGRATSPRYHPDLVLELFEAGALAREGLHKAAWRAWVATEYPEQNGGTERWQGLWESLGFIDDDGPAVRPAEPLRLYRGVGDEREVEEGPYGMSWTDDLDQAQWFAERFSYGQGEGMILVADVEPERLYAHFTERMESEWLVQTRGLDVTVHDD